MPLTTFGQEFFCKRIFARDSVVSSDDRFLDMLEYYVERLEMGDGLTPATESSQDLSGTNRAHKVLTPADITYNSGQITVTATFQNNEANFVWLETGLWAYNGSTRKLLYLDNIDGGTEKLSNQSRPRVLTFPVV